LSVLDFLNIFKAWKVIENRQGAWKSLHIYQKVLESAGIWFCKISYLNTGLPVLVLDSYTSHVKLSMFTEHVDMLIKMLLWLVYYIGTECMILEYYMIYICHMSQLD